MSDILGAVVQILTLIGAMGFFLYGMKVMSESLQKFAGSKIRNWLSRKFSSLWKSIFAGILITGIIQSSSATTVMLLSFVNAGLISFKASIGIVFGANIGTTVTAWIISLAGIKSGFDFYLIVLPLVGIALPFFFSAKNIHRVRAEFVMGFAILFVGLYLFKQNIPSIDETSGIFDALHSLSAYRYINILVFIGLGMVITILFQSSSATIALTMVLANQEWLSLDDALAMVLGENIGTTFTAIFASMVGNRAAKRTALVHLLFNLIGVIWAFTLFGFLLKGIEEAIRFLMESTGKPVEVIVPVGIAIFHSSFNIINTILFVIFFKPFHDLCLKLLPNGQKSEFALKYIGSGVISVSEMSVVQVKMEVAQMGLHIARTFKLIPDLLVEKNERKFYKKLKVINRHEEGIDDLEISIANFITRLFQSNLTENGSRQLRAMLKIVDDLENIADMCYQMSLTIARKNESGAWFTPELREKLDLMIGKVDQSIELMNEHLKVDFGKIDFARVKIMESEINELRNDLRKSSMEGLKNNEYPYQTVFYFSNLIGLLEKIGDYIYNVNQSLNGQS